MSQERLELGREAEALAERVLREKGYQIVARNHRCPRGEVDLIARRGGCLVFVEVRSKRGAEFGDPLESVTPRKQQRLARAAGDYLARQGGECEARFDVIAISYPGSGDGAPRVEHIENAFDWPTGMWQG